jgi:hypothetical protein
VWKTRNVGPGRIVAPARIVARKAIGAGPTRGCRRTASAAPTPIGARERIAVLAATAERTRRVRQAMKESKQPERCLRCGASMEWRHGTWQCPKCRLKLGCCEGNAGED